mmetsp:Transcript_22054/g.47743  ORF Transcript_22054/g.47743 Transcript_22054/m.47743 type:complete len:324 (+) Transcript_22054:89-1060(+)
MDYRRKNSVDVPWTMPAAELVKRSKWPRKYFIEGQGQPELHKKMTMIRSSHGSTKWDNEGGSTMGGPCALRGATTTRTTIEIMVPLRWPPPPQGDQETPIQISVLPNRPGLVLGKLPIVCSVKSTTTIITMATPTIMLPLRLRPTTLADLSLPFEFRWRRATTAVLPISIIRGLIWGIWVPNLTLWRQIWAAWRRCRMLKETLFECSWKPMLTTMMRSTKTKMMTMRMAIHKEMPHHHNKDKQRLRLAITTTMQDKHHNNLPKTSSNGGWNNNNGINAKKCCNEDKCWPCVSCFPIINAPTGALWNFDLFVSSAPLSTRVCAS